MYTRQRTRKSGGTLIAPKALAPKAPAPKALGRESDEGASESAAAPKALALKTLGRESDLWEGSESRVPEWGSVAGSPGRQRSRGRDTFPAPTRG